MAPTYLALCGKLPTHVQGLSTLLQPKNYNIIHVCTSLQTAVSELPQLLASSSSSAPPKPSSGYGSNATIDGSLVDGSQLSAILIGGGFSAEDVQLIKATTDKVREVPVFRADTSVRRDPGAVGPPKVEEIADRVLEALEREREGEAFKMGVHLF
jgi:hypothetical protein